MNPTVHVMRTIDNAAMNKTANERTRGNQRSSCTNSDYGAAVVAGKGLGLRVKGLWFKV